jgi:serine protease
MTRSVFLFGAAAAVAGLAACTGEVVSTTNEFISFEEFEANTYHEDFEGGVYIVNGDTPIEDIKALEEFWSELYAQGALAVHQSGGVDAKWSNTQKKNLTYCVSDTFGSRKAAAVNAMAQAAAAWEAVADVDFHHIASQDSNCTASNNNVLFDVRPVSGQPYVARAFFPGNSRSSRNVLIDSSAFGNMGVWTLKGVMIHELGHTLGFRHEHTRPEAGRCYEDSRWRPLTQYDSKSVMHYPQCNGTNSGDLVITSLDAPGARALYGAPGGGGGDPQPPPTGTPRTGQASGSVVQGQWQNYTLPAGQDALAGTVFRITMTGSASGDPDLYVRFGAAPTTTQFHCRPYKVGPNETCELNVPATNNKVHIGVRGYSAGTSTFTLNASWTSP